MLSDEILEGGIEAINTKQKEVSVVSKLIKDISNLVDEFENSQELEVIDIDIQHIPINGIFKKEYYLELTRRTK